MRDLLAELTSALEQERDCVYCSVVETRGSTPQKAGAAMLIFPDGSQRGTLGGGCVEAEVRLRALRSLTTGQVELHTFSLDDNYGWDDGLICGGRMSILSDPLPNATGPTLQRRRLAADYYRTLRQLVEGGCGCTEAVVTGQDLGLPAGSRYLFDGEGKITACLPVNLDQKNGKSALEVIDPKPLRQRPGPSVQRGVAYLPILPRITLLIVGGGHVGQAVAKLAAEVDFDVWILDDRERYASKERFPHAQQIVIGDIGATLKELAGKITPSTYCLIVTRGHSHDEEALYHLARTQAGYVGMIGSKRKRKMIYEDLVAKGIAQEVLSRVHSPLGFDIGSQTVPEIAISILAELICCRNRGATIPEARQRDL